MLRFLIVQGKAGALVQYPGTSQRRYVGITPKPHDEAKKILAAGGHYADCFNPIEEVVHDDHERHMHQHIASGELELLGVVHGVNRGTIKAEDIAQAKAAHADKKTKAEAVAKAAAEKAQADADAKAQADADAKAKADADDATAAKAKARFKEAAPMATQEQGSSK